MNELNYIVQLDRLEVCDLLLACTHIAMAAREEMKNDPNCPEYRREHVLPGTIKKWTDLHDKIEKQLNVLDALNFSN